MTHDEVFARLRDATRWSTWAGAPIAVSRWREPGPTSGAESVVGHVRLVGSPQYQTAEEVTIDEYGTTEHVHGYRLLSQWPVRDYTSRVEVGRTDDGGTRVRWSGEFTERVPGTGLLWRRFVVNLLGRAADRLVTVPAVTDPKGSAG
ncbi:SRPBCC family protein [Antrihabitans sp. YC3-6]|uniref:SRPBCC family protein n=1 Tax=Antrihabitans stalagmiti TaxID=2799499 RepID=A0A934U2D6_9NOCA|nr:SRPBCC family protein [Antrihabitans stalagmiti]